VLAAAGKTTNPKDLARVLRRFGVPRTTYLAWLERWQELGTVDDARLGRPPARVRSIVREEVERGLEKWLGTPHPDDESDPA
jgi:hypothetical protein